MKACLFYLILFVSFESFAICTPKFGPYDGSPFGQWMGGDAAYSVALGGGRTLWVFGDSFMNKSKIISRVGAQLVGNTLAVSTCVNGVFKITYNWRLSGFRFKPFFETASPETFRYWPAQPWLLNGVLYVPLLRVESISTGLGFRVTNTQVAIIDNPNETPDRWKIVYKNLIAEPNVNGGEGVFVNSEYVYLLNGIAGGTSLARIRVTNLKANPSGIENYVEYLNLVGAWEPHHRVVSAFNIGLKAGSGLTVRWDSTRQKLLALYSDFSDGFSKGVAISMADSLRGPWSPSVRVFTYPETNPASLNYNPTVHCYAAYEQHLFSAHPTTQLAFTYNCNSLYFSELVSNLGIYFPRFVRVNTPF